MKAGKTRPDGVWQPVHHENRYQRYADDYRNHRQHEYPVAGGCRRSADRPATAAAVALEQREVFVLDFQKKSIASPKKGTTPSSKSIPDVEHHAQLHRPWARACGGPGGRRTPRIAVSSIAGPRESSPISGSQPNRRWVPGTRNCSSEAASGRGRFAGGDPAECKMQDADRSAFARLCILAFQNPSAAAPIRR